jgi:hypothetical protein
MRSEMKDRNADPSTSLRSAQDDSILYLRVATHKFDQRSEHR